MATVHADLSPGDRPPRALPVSMHSPGYTARCRHAYTGVILSLLVIIGGCASIPASRLAGGSQTVAGALNSSLVVWSWNIHKGMSQYGPSIATADSVLGKLDDVDLLLLQEVCITADRRLQGLDDLLDRRGFGWWAALSFESDWYGCGANMATGVATAARTEPQLTLSRRSHGREFGITPKTILAQTFAMEGHAFRLLVINAHLLNFELITHADYRRQLTWIAARIADHAGPVILAGDLSTHNRRRMTLLEDMAAALCLQPVFTEEGERTRDFLSHRYPLDHIYYRGLAVSASEVGGEAGAGLSDHNSLYAEFRVASDTPGDCAPVPREVVESIIQG